MPVNIAHGQPVLYSTPPIFRGKRVRIIEPETVYITSIIT